MTDVGLEAVDIVRSIVLPDDPWTSCADRGFTWIGHRLRQTITASPVFQDDGLTLSRLTAKTVVVDDVDAPEDVVLSLISRLNRNAFGNAYTYLQVERRIEATAVAYVHRDTVDWRARQFGLFSSTQIAMAESEADYLADRAGGTIATAEHPGSGRRGTPDEALENPDWHIAKQGREPSRFADRDEFDTIEYVVKHWPQRATMGAYDCGIAIEFPFGTKTSLARLETHLAHRRFGNGLSVRLFLPINDNTLGYVRMANALNLGEAAGASESSHFGAWCCDCFGPGESQNLAVVYQMFLPNTLHRTGVAQDAAMGATKRARWVDWGAHGRESATDPGEVMHRNLHTWLAATAEKHSDLD